MDSLRTRTCTQSSIDCFSVLKCHLRKLLGTEKVELPVAVCTVPRYVLSTGTVLATGTAFYYCTVVLEAGELIENDRCLTIQD